MHADRAKLFIPFDALTGFDEALRKKEKCVKKRLVLSEDQIEYINEILSQLEAGDMAELKYYKDCESGYTAISGMISDINTERNCVFVDGKKIRFKDIYDIKLL